MSDPPKDQVLLLHASDCLEWAHFIASRLATPTYNIACKISELPNSSDDTTDNDVSTTTTTATAATTTTSTTTTTNNNSSPDIHIEESIYCNDEEEVPTDSNSNSTLSTTLQPSHLEKPVLPEKRASRISNSNISTETSTNPYLADINSSRASVIFISPGIVESSKPLPFDLNSLKPGSTVYIFLGVELVDARSFFGANIDIVTKSKCGFVYSTEQQTITDALIQIIEAYEDTGESEQSEDDDNIYNVPTNTRQFNAVEKIFPKQLTETDRDVCIVLKLPPEDSLELILEGDELVEKKIDLVAMGDRLYTFTLPDGIVGDVRFHLECQGERFGRTKIQAPSKLERLHAILESEVDPLALLASAVNIPKSDLGDLDATLAHKLEQLSPAIKYKHLFPFEDDVKHSHTDRPSSVKWPTLLHFAAEWNLRTLCLELLRYPGMVLAACTENSSGEFPSQIASRKGFTDLEADLLHFMEKEERESEYIEHSPPLPPPRVSSSTEAKTAPKVARRPPSKQTANTSDGNVYCDMTVTGKSRAIGTLKHQRSESEITVGRRPESSAASRISSSRSFGQGDADVKQKHASIRHSNSENENWYAAVDDRPDIHDWMSDTYGQLTENSGPDGTLTPRNASPSRNSPTSGSPSSLLKASKLLGVCESEIRNSTFDIDNRAPSEMYLSASCPPNRLPKRSSSKFYVDPNPNSSYSEEYLLPYEQIYATDNKRTLKKERIMSFFSKIKGGSKKSSTLKSRRGSESSEHKSPVKNLTLDLERDSGSYSDEENESKPVKNRLNKSKVFKESEKPWARRVSKRVESAKRETISNYPNLPSVGNRTKLHSKK